MTAAEKKCRRCRVSVPVEKIATPDRCQDPQCPLNAGARPDASAKAEGR